MKTAGFCAVAAFLLLWTVPAFSQHMHHENGKAESAADTSRVGNQVYSCPMHPEVVSDKPGRCPKCGMKLEQITPKATKDTTQTNRSQTPGSSDEMAVGMEMSDHHAHIKSESSARTGAAKHDSTANCLPADQSRDDDQPSCCTKNANVKKSGAPTKRK